MNTRPTPDPTNPDNDELAGFVDRWAAAIVANDPRHIGTFMTDDWILIDRPGVISRADFLQAVSSGRLSHRAMTHDTLAVDRRGPVAVIRTRGRNTACFDGQVIEADEWTTDLLIEGPDGWRCFLTQLTPADQSDS